MAVTKTDAVRLRIKEIRSEGAEVKTFTLQPLNSSFSYLAGQFVTFIFKDDRRSYSFSTAPAVDDEVAITVKRVTNGRFSRPLIDTAQVGDELDATIATGQFTLPDVLTPDAKLIFFAAGIGITPIFSLVKEALATTGCAVMLVYSNSSRETTIFYKELEVLAAQYRERLHIVYLFSNNKNLLRSRLSREVLPDIVKPAIKNLDTANVFCYVCGPHSYMRMVIWGLEELHIPTDNIRREQFVTQHYVPKLAPPDTAAHTVTIEAGSQKHSLSVQYPTSILQAARKAGLALPYSCNTGQCGSCAAQCISGAVWMSYNEVLTEKDIAQGKILTCTGFPLTDDVRIRL